MQERTKVVLKRYYQDDFVTLGNLQILNVDHKPIYILENPWKANIKNVSCIPSGTYICGPYSGMKFKDVYKVRNVPNRTDILIHIGNYTRETSGCILPGRGVNYINEPMVTHSTLAMNMLRKMLGDSTFELTIKDC